MTELRLTWNSHKAEIETIRGSIDHSSPKVIMSNFPKILRSLVLTSMFSFLAPILLLVASTMLLLGLRQLPPLEPIARICIEQVAYVLSIFGSGSPIRGLMVIGIACGVVGFLFDSYTLFRNSVNKPT